MAVGFDGAGVNVDEEGRVISWIDQIGGYDATPPSQDTRPILETVHTGSGYHPVLHFNDGLKYLRTQAFSSPFAQTNVIFIVASRSELAINYLFDGLDSSNRNALYTRSDFSYGMFAGSQIINSNVVSEADPDNYQVFMASFNGSSGLMRINGTNVLSGNVGAHSLTGLTIGANNSGSQRFNGRIAELLIYNGGLNTAQILEIESYLTDKYITAIDWKQWDNGGTGRYWTTPANWTGDSLPDEGDNLLIDMEGNSCAIITASMTDLPLYGTIAVGYEDAGEIQMLGGNLSCNNIDIGVQLQSDGFLNIRAGQVSISNTLRVGIDGVGKISLSDAQLNAGEVILASNQGANSQLELSSGASLNVAGMLKMGSGSANLDIDGGVLTAYEIVLAYGNAAVSVISISSGSLTGDSLVFGSGEGLINLCGGELTVSGEHSAGNNITAYNGDEGWYVETSYNSSDNTTLFKAARFPDVSVTPDMFDYGQADTLGLDELVGTETITIYAPVDETDMKFSNHPQLIEFKGMLYANWIWHPEFEISAESWAVYSRSADGVNWSQPQIIGPDKRAVSGWWTDGETLVCYLVTNWKTEALTSTDGVNWSQPQVIIENASPSESPKATPSGRLIMPSHGYGTGQYQDVRLTRIMFTDDPQGITGWTQAVLPHPPEISESETTKIMRPCEPSWFVRNDGALVMLFRDLWFDAQLRTWKLLSSVSYDDGETWQMPALTNIPDSDSMQCAGNLPDGTAYFVNNPIATRRRVPLTVTLSKNGRVFDRSYLVRGTPQERRYYGPNKTLGYSYPGSTVFGDYLYIGYATNKEDVEITRIPLSLLKADRGFEAEFQDFSACWTNTDDYCLARFDYNRNGWIEYADYSVLAQTKKVFPNW